DQSIYYLLATVVVVFVIVTVAQALVMKLAVALCQGEPIGVLFGGFVSWTMALCGGIASTTLAAVTNDAAGALGALLAAIAGSVAFLCLALRMSPVRAFGVCIIHTMANGLVLFLLGIGSIVFLRSICEPNELIALQNGIAKQ